MKNFLFLHFVKGAQILHQFATWEAANGAGGARKGAPRALALTYGGIWLPFKNGEKNMILHQFNIWGAANGAGGARKEAPRALSLTYGGIWSPFKNCKK